MDSRPCGKDGCILGRKIMLTLWLQLIFMILIILVASQIFTNALEYFGEEVGFSTGVTGSIFAAVATALPETVVPILAIFAGTSNKLVNHEISVGAILGAPLMLSTLSTCLMAMFVIKRRGIRGKLHPERTGFIRDLNFFLIAFFFAALAMYVPHHLAYLRLSISFILIGIYIGYLFLTFKASKKLVMDGHGVMTEEPLIFAKLGLKSNKKTILIQLVLSLVLLLLGAKGFISSVEKISKMFDISALLLSLIIIPIATELPEKVNSILWVRKNKDTLGFGNITGAMVFQGTLLPAIGILLTPWEPNRLVETGIFITLSAAIWLRFNSTKKGIRILALTVNGILYLLYLCLAL